MADFDVFNGDADGICALQQLRLAEPRKATLVSGVKRDIALLERVDAERDDRVTVLDISLDKNREGLLRALAAGASVRYFDHHFAGEIPEHDALETHIDPSPETCTSLIVDRVLDGAHRRWAITGAFGDNFDEQARAAATAAGLSDGESETLKHLGILLNYNGYGATLEDLFFDPVELFKRVHPYADPLEFVQEDPAYSRLASGYADDMARVEALRPELEEPAVALYLLPDAAWSRRVGGVFGNALARKAPGRAHAIVSEMADGTYRISVRAPLENRTGADELCRSFPTGGGRSAAAGINALPRTELDTFVERFRAQYA